MNEIELIAAGPLFNGMVEEHIHAYLASATAAVAQRGLDLVHTNLHNTIQHPSSPPYYENQIVADRSVDTTVIHDTGVVYGPWLEGVGSRNQTTRFKGYWSFRRARSRLEGEAPAIANRVLVYFLPRMVA